MASSDHCHKYDHWQVFLYHLQEMRYYSDQCHAYNEYQASYPYQKVSWCWVNIFSLKLVLSPLNLLITLDVIALSFFSLYDFFCLCAPFHLPGMSFLILPFLLKYSVVSISLSLFYLYFISKCAKRINSMSK